MSHFIHAFIAKEKDLLVDIDYIKLPQGFVLFESSQFIESDDKDFEDADKLEENFKDFAKKINAISPHLLSIDTDYFGGSGDQFSVFISENKEAKHFNTINEGLRFIGVIKNVGEDEFDTMRLGEFRTNEDIIDAYETAKINVNIWDDYYEDGYVPEGKLQETFIKCEEPDYKEEFKYEVMLFLEKYLKSLTYPHIKFTYAGDKINVIGMSHKDKDKILKHLLESKLRFNGFKFNFYSES